MPGLNVIRRIVLPNDTVLNECECGYADGNLWCYLKNLTFVEAFQIFSDPSKVGTITFEYGLESQYTRVIYTGFTIIKTITSREYTIDVCMNGTNTSIREEEVVE